ncbi:MAG: T9SS type A sorting domain-containing protein, partial [Hymenobacter sp.]
AKSNQSIYFDDVTLDPQKNTAPTVTLAATSNLVLGKALTLSATATDTDGTISKVEFFNGSTSLGTATSAPYQLNWTPTTIGLYSLTARATDNMGASTTSAAVSVQVALPAISPIAAVPTSGNGKVVNPGFELDGAEVDAPAGWSTLVGNGTPASVDYTETYGGAHSGTYHGTHWRYAGAYEVYTYQTVTGLPNGTYAFSAWVKSSGGQPTAQLQAQNYGGSLLTTAITATNGNWVQLTVNGINVTNGQCEIGFYSQAKSNQYIYFDDVTLAPQSVSTTNSVGNFSFEDDNAGVLAPRQWLTQTGGSTQAYASYSESYPNAHSGTYHGTHYRPEAYQIYTYQTLTGLANGTYTLSAWVKSKGGQPVAQLRAQNYGGTLLSAAIPTSTTTWVQITIPSVTVTNGQCEIGIYSQANAGQWLYFDDISFLPASASAASSFAKADLTATDAAVIPALYPNPANDQVTLTTTVAQESSVTIVISDLQGNIMASYQRKAVAGENQFVLNTNSLASGLYILRIQGSDTSSAQRLEVKH